MVAAKSLVKKQIPKAPEVDTKPWAQRNTPVKPLVEKPTPKELKDEVPLNVFADRGDTVVQSV